MKHLVLTLWFVLSLSSIGLARVEYVTEEVCPALAGCWINVKTGECPDCVIERLEVAHTHEEKPVVVEKHIRTVATTTTKKKSILSGRIGLLPSIKKRSTKTWVGTLFKCMVGCRYAYWDSAGNDYDENMKRVFN